MARTGTGAYVLPAGNPVVTGTVISSTWANTTFADIATEIGQSLDRGGSGEMDAPLKLANGSLGNPALTFASEATSGLYLAGTNDVRMSIGGIAAMHWNASGVVMPAGLTITQSTVDGVGATITGNGAGTGAVITGGNSSGTGATITAGLNNGIGLVVVGKGTGTGATITAGATNAAGAVITASGTGTGATITGGATSGTAIVALGGAPNGIAVTATGDGSGAAYVGTGGDSSGPGATITGGLNNGIGLVVLGKGTGEAVVATGGSGASAISATSGNSGNSAISAVGVSGGRALHASSSATNVVVAGIDGYVDMSLATAPTSNTAYKNHITSSNIVKAWYRCTTNASVSPTTNGRFNMTGVTASSAGLTFTFAQAMSAGDYAVSVTCSGSGSTSFYTASAQSSSATEVTVRLFLVAADVAGVCHVTYFDPTTAGTPTINVIVVGNQ